MSGMRGRFRGTGYHRRPVSEVRGYTQGDAADEIFRHTPARLHGQDRAERIDYCRRLTDYAFGAVGEIDLTSVRPTPEQIQKFNRESDSIAQEEIEHNRSIIHL